MLQTHTHNSKTGRFVKSASPPPLPPPAVDTSDPLYDVFGPGSNVKMYGDLGDTLPQELCDFLQANGLSEKSFQVILKQHNEGASTGNGAFIKSWTKGVPSIEFIAKEYGPGEYFFIVMWRDKYTEDGKERTTPKSQQIDFEISDKYEYEYREYQLAKKEKLIERRKERMRHTKMESTLDPLLSGPEQVDPSEAGKKYVSEIVEAAKSLGLTNKPAFDFGQLLPVIVPAIPAILQALNSNAQAQASQMQTLMATMITMSQANNSQLVEALKVAQGSGAGASSVKEFKDMLLGVVDIKEAIMGDKETTTDKIFKVIEAIAPQILALAAMPKAARAANPIYNFGKSYAENMPEIKALKDTPEMQESVIRRLDAFYGWEQANMILDVSGIKRPPSCPMIPGQQYPANDPRNSTSATATVASVEETIQPGEVYDGQPDEGPLQEIGD